MTNPSDQPAAKSAICAGTPPFSICVYCGSQTPRDPVFVDAARAVGTWIGERGGQLVYGGGHTGLMGVVADATLAAGGRVVGIIPQSMVEREWAHHGCTELHIVETMHQRKYWMAERSTAFLALAGGIGTLEELFEIWTWRQLDYHHKPIGILNTHGFYDALLHFMQGVFEQGFMYGTQMGMVHVGTEPAATLQTLLALQDGTHAQKAPLAERAA